MFINETREGFHVCEKSWKNTSVILGSFVCLFAFPQIIKYYYHRFIEYPKLDGTHKGHCVQLQSWINAFLNLKISEAF